MEVIFWVSINGDSPVTDYIDQLPDKTKKKIIKTLDLIQKYGVGFIKTCTKLTGTCIYELKIRFDKVFYRIFFVIYKTVCHILHIFKKKSNKAPIRDIETAENRFRTIKLAYT